MRRINGHYECTLCTAELDISEGTQPQIMLMTASGGSAERVIVASGHVVHRCPVIEPALAAAKLGGELPRPVRVVHAPS